MGDIKLSISIKEENNILFKRCVRKLLDSTFIVGDKDEKLYSFISRESNRQDISDYLRMIGFDVLVDTNVKIAMLKPHEADEEAVGLKRANVVSFTTEQYHLDNVGKPDRRTVNEINDIMNNSIVGWKQKTGATKRFEKYGIQKYWYREEAVNKEFVSIPKQMEIPFDSRV